MGRLRRFLGLPLADKWLLFKTWVLIWVVRVGLWTLHFGFLRRMLKQFSGRPSRRLSLNPHSPHRLSWAVRVASRYVPGAKHCLTRALAMEVLLARRGHPVAVHIGVAPDGSGQIKAHAWVESDGQVVIGGEGLEDFTKLTPGKG